jgi:hypothetical protein
MPVVKEDPKLFLLMREIAIHHMGGMQVHILMAMRSESKNYIMTACPWGDHTQVDSSLHCCGK